MVNNSTGKKSKALLTGCAAVDKGVCSEAKTTRSLLKRVYNKYS